MRIAICILVACFLGACSVAPKNAPESITPEKHLTSMIREYRTTNTNCSSYKHPGRPIVFQVYSHEPDALKVAEIEKCKEDLKKIPYIKYDTFQLNMGHPPFEGRIRDDLVCQIMLPHATPKLYFISFFEESQFSDADTGECFKYAQGALKAFEGGIPNKSSIHHS